MAGRRGYHGATRLERRGRTRNGRPLRRGRQGGAAMRVMIAGGGIGGLVAAVSLHDAGIDATVFEAVGEIRPLGVGINLLPHAVRELSELGLAERLDAVAIRTRELVYV